MMKSRTSQDKTVEDGDGYTHLRASFERTQHTAGAGAMNIESFVHAGMNSWNNVRLPIYHEPHVTIQSFIENFFDLHAIVRSAGRPAVKRSAWSRREVVHCLVSFFL